MESKKVLLSSIRRWCNLSEETSKAADVITDNIGNILVEGIDCLEWVNDELTGISKDKKRSFTLEIIYNIDELKMRHIPKFSEYYLGCRMYIIPNGAVGKIFDISDYIRDLIETDTTTKELIKGAKSHLIEMYGSKEFCFNKPKK